jgi:peptide/nickel transport system substrate-binding protein
MMKKTALLGLVVMAVALFVIPTQVMGQPKYGGTLIIGLTSDMNKIDPHLLTTAIEGRIGSVICNGLVEYTKEMRIGPALAESWEVTPDAKEWTFHLRKGVKFHNGRELTAEDIKWNLERMLNPETKSTRRSRLIDIESIQVIDRYTAKAILKTPSAGFLANFVSNSGQVPIMAPESMNEKGIVTHPIGTGPFQFVEWKQNEHIKLKKFNDFWVKGLPFLDEVIFKPVPDITVRMTALKTGEIHLSRNLDLTESAKLKKKGQKEVQFDLRAEGDTNMVHFNMAKPPFNDIKMRRAFLYGIDKNDILQAVWRGYGETVNHAFIKASQWHCELPETQRNVEKARALLKEAGYPNGLDLTIAATHHYAWSKMSAEVIQAQLSEIGIRVKLDILDWPSFVKKVVGGDFTAGVAGITGVADPGTVFQLYFASDATYGFLTGKAYKSAQLDELMKQGKRRTDVEKRRAAYCSAAQTVVDDIPWIFLTASVTAWGWRSELKDFFPHTPQFVYSDGGIQYAWIDK